MKNFSHVIELNESQRPSPKIDSVEYRLVCSGETLWMQLWCPCCKDSHTIVAPKDDEIVRALKEGTSVVQHVAERVGAAIDELCPVVVVKRTMKPEWSPYRDGLGEIQGRYDGL